MPLSVNSLPTKATTSGSVGANFIAFPDVKASAKLIITNSSNVDIDVQIKLNAQFITIPARTPFYPVYGILSAKDVGVRRNDQVAVAVDVFAQAVDA